MTDWGRVARAEGLGDYFGLQLEFAERMASDLGLPLHLAVARYTNLHKRFGLGDGGQNPGSVEWARFAEGLDPAASVRDWTGWAQAFYAQRPEETLGEDRIPFGCFACEAPLETGAVRLHFGHRQEDAGPLTRERMPARLEELRAMFSHIRQTYPQARSVLGGSWLYNLEAYRRLFPAEYGDSRTVPEGPVSLRGTSTWGQFLDRREGVRPEARAAFLRNLETLDVTAPWLSFPLRALKASAPVEIFYSFYGV